MNVRKMLAVVAAVAWLRLATVSTAVGGVEAHGSRLLLPTPTPAPAVAGDLALGGQLLAPAWPLPPGWKVLRGRAAAAAVQVDAPADVLLAAWAEAPHFATAPVRLTVVRTPRHDLSLARYAASAAAELTTAGFSVRPAEITTTVRPDGLPVAVVAFTSGPHTGYQVAAFDTTGEHLWLITLAAPADQLAARRNEVTWMLSQAKLD